MRILNEDEFTSLAEEKKIGLKDRIAAARKMDERPAPPPVDQRTEAVREVARAVREMSRIAYDMQNKVDATRVPPTRWKFTIHRDSNKLITRIDAEAVE